jgi:major vault protein
LAPNEFAFISDQTKGNINVYVGPYKSSLANTDQPVFFNSRSKKFEPCSLERATSLFPTAPEGWYVVLKNPEQENTPPQLGTVNNLARLQVGHKVNIPGPISFALWPGQMVRIVQGHHLRSNQYLVVRIYDEASARENWGKAVLRPKTGVDSEGEEAVGPEVELPDLVMGKQLVIKGTEVSFYIPPTGVEVVRDAQGQYVREAVTLERLEYCILLDEDGNKRFIKGPAVVFPEPTETFVVREGRRKFKAIELGENSGLYIKVIAPYQDEGGASYKMGEELFITGREQMIYFPRTEHAIIKYGSQEIHYAVAIPAGEGRYCLDRQTGQVRLVRGPCIFLPDPRREVIVRRVLEPRKVALWFPGNQEALEYNLKLKRLLAQGSGDYVPADALEAQQQEDKKERQGQERQESKADEGFAGDDFTRGTSYTPPRTITLDTRYDGAVTVSVWTGYAVLVVSRSGERRVIAGPTTHLLEYDENLEPVELSTGTPKGDDALLKTVYLRVLHNKVSDVVQAETRDLAQVSLSLSYRVNFEGDPEQWFNVENYVKFLCDHMRSLLRNAVKRRGIQEFYANSIDTIRDTVLGLSVEGQGRPGRLFEENGMRVYDVEILDVTIGDEKIERLLLEAQHNVVNQTLELAAQERRLAFVKRSEEIKRQVLAQEALSERLERELEAEAIGRKLEVTLSELTARHKAKAQSLESSLKEQGTMTQIHEAELERKKSSAQVDDALEQARLERRLEELRAQVDAVVHKANAVSPDLIAALQAFSDRALTERVAESMAPLAILGGRSVADVLGQLLEGTALEKVSQAAGALTASPAKAAAKASEDRD